MTPAPTGRRALQRLDGSIFALGFALGALLYAVLAVSRASAGARRAYRTLSWQYDDLARVTLASHTARDSWLRLTKDEQLQVLDELRQAVDQRDAGDPDVAAAIPPITVTAEDAFELGRVAFFRGRRARALPEDAFEPDPTTLDDCTDCASPAACQAERHCRAQLPEPEPEPGQVVTPLEERYDFSPGYTTGDDA